MWPLQWHVVVVCLVLGFPKAAARFGDWLEGLAGFRELVMCAAKTRYRGRGEGTVSKGKAGRASRSAGPVESHRTHFIPPTSNVTAWGRNVVCPGSSLETQCPRVLLGAGHVGPLSLARTQTPDPQRKGGILHTPYCVSNSEAP